MEVAEIGAISALVVGIMTVFMGYLTKISKDNREERRDTAKANAAALSVLADALTENTNSNREIAEATKRSANEAKERNGHLAELTLGNRDVLTGALDQMGIAIKQHKGKDC